ncbi:MAG: GTP-binding protein [Pyrinomonadaceae bacterium]|nr:GTP-binding protein [Pyrinomonadaceae bacterium]
MLQKKICMLGATGVGKTSLVRRFVQSVYTDKYHTTIGVKIDKKTVEVNGQNVNLMIWDVQGEDDGHKIRPAYLRGASGYLLIIDATRPETLQTATAIQNNLNKDFPDTPFIAIINKTDLTDEIKLSPKDLTSKTWTILQTSAKTGDNVENAFKMLSQKMLESR